MVLSSHSPLPGILLVPYSRILEYCTLLALLSPQASEGPLAGLKLVSPDDTTPDRSEVRALPDSPGRDCGPRYMGKKKSASSGVLSRQEPRELWLKARAGLPRKTLVEGAGRQRRVQPAPRALRDVSGWACVVLRHNLANSEGSPAGHPSGCWIPFFPSLLSIGA